MGIFPAEDGAVFADADDNLLVGADAKFVDLPAMPNAHVGHAALLVIPHLQESTQEE